MIEGERLPKPIKPGRRAIISLFQGTFAGAFSAAVGAAAGLFFAVFLLAILKAGNDPAEALQFSTIICAFGAIFAGMIGAPLGFLLSLADTFLRNRFHAPDFPGWLWLPIGAALGIIGCGLLSAWIFGMPPGFVVVIGGFCGLIAGPIFGWLYRDRSRLVGLNHESTNYLGNL